MSLTYCKALSVTRKEIFSILELIPIAGVMVRHSKQALQLRVAILHCNYVQLVVCKAFHFLVGVCSNHVYLCVLQL